VIFVAAGKAKAWRRRVSWKAARAVRRSFSVVGVAVSVSSVGGSVGEVVVVEGVAVRDFGGGGEGLRFRFLGREAAAAVG
jgi:hypothetical protein